MNTTRILAANLAVSAGLLLAPVDGHAAESYDNCTGFIDSIPTTITTQGVWCLRNNVSTNLGYGYAIDVQANNVTIDCNNFKVGGLAAGNASNGMGIFAYQRNNVTIRNCGIRGFKYGIVLNSGAGHLVEDNLLDNNLSEALRIFGGDNIVVRRNRIFDTGGLTNYKWTTAIYAEGADVIDNTVRGIFVDVSGGYVRGMQATGTGIRVSGNTFTGLETTAVKGGLVDYATGIFVGGKHMRIFDNLVSVIGGSYGGGSISVNGGSTVSCTDNTMGGFDFNDAVCSTEAGNVVLP